MAQFTTTALMGGGTLVEGTDETGKTGRTLLQSDKFDMYLHVIKHKEAEAIFSGAVETVLAPIMAAAEEVEALMASPSQDFSRVVISDGTEFEPAEFADFDTDGTILNILRLGRFDLLRWIGDDLLVAIQP